MKFYLLAPGQRFEYKGEIYVKTRPLIALHEASGKERLIPRSANVSLIQGYAPPPSPPPEPEQPPLQAEAVLEAFDAFYARCLLCLEELEPELEPQRVKTAHENLREARRRFMASLALTSDLE